MGKRKKATTKRKAETKTASLADLKLFLTTNVENLEYDSGGGHNLLFPAYDLMPQDYLGYAAEALDDPTDANRINCISHLKRAAECQADTLFYVMSLNGHKKTSNFPSKMNAIAALGLMPSRSVAELNRIRNKMEHEYAIPQVSDLTLYFDLVAGFVSSVEGAIFMLASNAEMHYFSQHEEQVRVDLQIGFCPKTAAFNAKMTDANGIAEFTTSPGEWDELIESLRVLFLMVRFGYIVSHKFVLQHLGE